jgi:endonuclease YncB( thermonuclease family)
MPFGKRRPEDPADPASAMRARAIARRNRGFAIPAVFWMGLGLMLAALGIAMSTLELPAGEQDPEFPTAASRAQSVALAEVNGLDRVRDGDTIVVGGTPVRLQGLHCPERAEPGGGAATLAMHELTKGARVSCALTRERNRDRVIGRCAANGADLGALMIGRGHCARCPRHDPDGFYLPAQRSAGPWRGALPRYC